MLKVAKFGGSSMADAKQFEKVRDIVRADPARKVDRRVRRRQARARTTTSSQTSCTCATRICSTA